MKSTIFFLLFLLSFSDAKYMDNKSCNECHEEIYEEFQSSMHSHGYFNDELHRKVADAVSEKKYECATCHMPMADNLKDLLSGDARPDKSNKTHTDAVSCYFCHTIAYVKKAHKFNINIKGRQAKDYKPTLYGRLTKPDDSDKHASVTNPVYAKNVCVGCHSHKLNENNVTIFSAMGKKDDSISCINCHMPEVEGGAEKMDKRARGQHASHKFLGIHDAKFRATGMDINISTAMKSIKITLTNKMDHPLIIQSARVKYLELKVIRNGKVVWRNYKSHPKEDQKVFFEYQFKGKDGKKMIIPATATGHLRVNNLNARERKTFVYDNLTLQKGDIVQAAMYVKFAKKDCQKAIKLNDGKLKKPYLIKMVKRKI